MADQAEYAPYLKEMFPAAGPDLLALLHAASEQALLLRSDFQALHDLLEIAGCQDMDVPCAILALLLVALEEGSLCMAASGPALARRLGDFLPAGDASAWAGRIEQALAERRYPALIGTAASDHRPIILHTREKQEFLYFQKYLNAECAFQRSLQARLSTSDRPRAGEWAGLVGETMREQTIVLDQDQQRALGVALESDLTIISGGPGTGKTSIVLTLLRSLLRAGVSPERIALAAPTGRAAQRLSERTRGASPLLAATTLHQLLGYQPQRSTFARHAENPIDADVVIVDEVSMVGVVLMAQLLQALPAKAKLVLLGDKDQLPSIDAGAVLAQLVDDERAAQRDGLGVVLLRTNYRSQQQIREAAQAINAQDAGVVDRLPALRFPAESEIDPYWRELETRGGCLLLEQTSATAGELRGYLQHWLQQAYFRSRADGHTLAELVGALEVGDRLDEPRFKTLFTLLDRFRLLTLVREGPWGCEEINAYLAEWLRPRVDAAARGHLFAGVPVLITRNDPLRGLFNGDVGIALRRRGGGLVVVFERDPAPLAISAEALPAHELGFALTVHKSQGSEYANVLVVLPPTGGRRLLTKELLYTAITRAKSLAVICGTKEVVKLAIGRRIRRE